jgi:hypothetical protein
MTEFVIMLPVFILIFVGIVQLHRLQQAVNRAHIMANKSMWEQAKEVQESSPASEWADPGRVAEVAPEPAENCPAERYHECAGFDWNKYKRLVDYGTFGEALSGARFEEITDWLDRHENATNWLNEDGSIDLRMYHEIYDTSDAWGAYAVTATWDRAHSDRAFEIPHGLEQGALDHFNNATLEDDDTPLVGGQKSAFAYAAGTRYGLILGNAVESASTTAGTFDYEIEYQTLAPPRPMEKDDEGNFTVGTSRLLMTNSGFDKIPGFEYDVRLDGFTIGTLEQ